MTARTAAPKPLDLAQFDGFGPGTWRAENGSIKALSHGTWTTVSVVHRSRFTPEGRAAIANVQAAAPALLAECKRQREQIKALREALEAIRYCAAGVDDQYATATERACLGKARSALDATK